MFVIKNNEKLMLCPFDKNHTVLPLRYENHVRKCALQHSTMPEICPFNAKHHVVKGELRHHLTVCPDKYRLEKEFVHQHQTIKKLESENEMGSSSCDISSIMTEHSNLQFPNEENWDREIDITVRPTRSIKSEKQAYTNKTKSERRKDREQAIEDFKKKQASKSDADETSSFTTDAYSSKYLNSALSTITENEYSDRTTSHRASMYQDDDTFSTRGSTISSNYSKPLGRGQSFSSSIKSTSILSAGTDFLQRSTVEAEYDSNSFNETLSTTSTQTQRSYASAARQSKHNDNKLYY